MADEQSFDLGAAELRADGADLAVRVEVLARKLEEALPEATTVQRRSRRMLSRDKVVASIEVRIAETRYGLRLQGSAIEADRSREVRGVVIRREPLGFDAWVSALTEDVREQAAGSAEARAALDRLVG
jgi:hypothetical protein